MAGGALPTEPAPPPLRPGTLLLLLCCCTLILFADRGLFSVRVSNNVHAASNAAGSMMLMPCVCVGWVGVGGWVGGGM